MGETEERLAAQLPPLGREVIGVGLFRRQPDDCGPREGKPRRKHPNHRVGAQAIGSFRAASGLDGGAFVLGGEEGAPPFLIRLRPGNMQHDFVWRALDVGEREPDELAAPERRGAATSS